MRRKIADSNYSTISPADFVYGVVKYIVGRCWSVIVPGQMVEVKWHYSNKEHFESKGYKFTKYNDVITVKTTELFLKSKVKVNVICDNCRKQYTQKYNIVIDRKHHFCNRDCYDNFIKINGSPKNTRVKVKCSNCLIEFETKKYRYEKFNKGETASLCCSDECRHQYLSETSKIKKNSSYKPRIIITCETCGEKFKIKQYRLGRAKYCSVKCQRIGVGKQNIPTKLIKVNCDKCGNEFQQWKHAYDRYNYHFCSAECRKKYQGVFMSRQQNDIEKTGCQLEVNKILKENDINFTNEYAIDYYSIDNYLIDYHLFIEVMGDYWHANPTTYKSYPDLNEVQKKRTIIDKSKHTLIKNKYGIETLYLWEKDILYNPLLCELLINLYLETNGNLENYHSFNYQIIDGKLELKYPILHSYFELANTNRQVSHFNNFPGNRNT